MGRSWQWQLLPWRTCHDLHKAPHIAVMRAVPGGLETAVFEAHQGKLISRTETFTADEDRAVPFKVRKAQHTSWLEAHGDVFAGGIDL